MTTETYACPVVTDTDSVNLQTLNVGDRELLVIRSQPGNQWPGKRVLALSMSAAHQLLRRLERELKNPGSQLQPEGDNPDNYTSIRVDPK